MPNIKNVPVMVIKINAISARRNIITYEVLVSMRFIYWLM